MAWRRSRSQKQGAGTAYAIDVCWEAPVGRQEGWSFGWYDTSEEAREAAQNALKASDADRIEILRGGGDRRGALVEEVTR